MGFKLYPVDMYMQIVEQKKERVRIREQREHELEVARIMSRNNTKDETKSINVTINNYYNSKRNNDNYIDVLKFL